MSTSNKLPVELQKVQQEYYASILCKKLDDYYAKCTADQIPDAYVRDVLVKLPDPSYNSMRVMFTAERMCGHIYKFDHYSTPKPLKTVVEYPFFSRSNMLSLFRDLVNIKHKYWNRNRYVRIAKWDLDYNGYNNTEPDLEVTMDIMIDKHSEI